MDKFLAFLLPILTFFSGVITTYYAPKKKAEIEGKSKVEEVKLEGDSKVEAEYIAGMRDVVKEYRESVMGYKKEVSELRKELGEMKDELKKEKEIHAQVILGYELALEKKDDEIEELQAIIITKDGIIAMLKGEI